MTRVYWADLEAGRVGAAGKFIGPTKRCVGELSKLAEVGYPANGYGQKIGAAPLNPRSVLTYRSGSLDTGEEVAKPAP